MAQETKTMSCDFTEKISSLIDGELSPREAREVEHHLVSCSECELLRADFLNLRSQITSFESSPTPEVHNPALQKILAPERWLPVRRLQWGFGTQAAAFATLVIVGAIIGLFFYQSKSSKQDEMAQVAEASPAPSASVDKQPTPGVSPQPSHSPEQPAPGKDQKETTAPRKPVKRPLARDPKPGEQFAALPDRARSADTETMTALHIEKSETLLRSFRNIRLDQRTTTAEVRYERTRAKQLIFQNMMLRREADASGDIQISSLLETLEPILLDIANLPNRPDEDSVRVIRERIERKNIVALLQVNSSALARALD